MSDVSTAEAVDATPMNAPEGTPDILSPSAAGRVLAAAREAKRQAAASAPPEVAAEPIIESTPEVDTTPPETEPSGETETQIDPEPEVPSIEPPRSWSKEARERWSRLDPDTQNYLLERDSTDSAAIRKAQNEAAEQRKAADAELQAAQQQRQQYEAALPILMQTFQAQNASQFSDVQSFADEQRLANEDPLRYTQYLAFQRQAQALQQEVIQANQRQEQEQVQYWHTFANKEDALFAQAVPEVADPDKAGKLRNAALKTLEDVGFTQEELATAWNKPNSLSLRDHRIQQLIVDASRHRTAQAVVKAPQPKQAPPQVVKPGVATGKNNVQEQRLKTLDEKLNTTGNWKDAARLLMERRAQKA